MARHLIGTALELKSLVAKATDQARERNTRIRVNDGDGLRVEITPSGNASWQVMYRMPGRSDRAFTIGAYPALSIKLAREIADEVRGKVARNIDPNEEKKAERQKQKAEDNLVKGPSTRKVLEAYLDNLLKAEGYSATSVETMMGCFERDVFSDIGDKPAAAVTPADIERILRRVEARRALESLRRIAGWLRKGFAFGQIRPNPVKAVDMDEFQKRPKKSKVGHPGATDPKTFAQVLRTIDAFRGSKLSRAALLIHARCFMRPDELRTANWSQVQGDFFNATVILEEGTFEHLIPLSPQAKALFEEIRPIHPTFILPGARYGQRMSQPALGRILHSLGWKDVHTTHGFRKSASTLLNEMGWDPRHVDFQLSHKLKGKDTEAVYNKALYLPFRIEIMRCWSDYIDALLDPTSGADEMQPLDWCTQWQTQNTLAKARRA